MRKQTQSVFLIALTKIASSYAGEKSFAIQPYDQLMIIYCFHLHEQIASSYAGEKSFAIQP